MNQDPVLPGIFADPVVDDVKPSAAGLREGRRRRDKGLAQAEANAPDPFRDAALAAWEAACRRHPFVTSDQLWDGLDLDQLPASAVPKRPAVIGAIIRGTVGRLVEPTDQFRNTTRAAGHARPVRVWRSLVYGGQ